MENSKSYLPEYQDKWLPSNNLQYPNGVLVYYSPFSFGDLLKISQSNFGEVELYNFILEGIRVVGMDKYDLTFYDVIYLGWRRKTASLGTSLVDVNCYCPNCDSKNIRNLDLKELDFVDLDIKAMPVKMKISEQELKFKFITIRDYLELLSEGKSNDVLSIYAKSVSNLPDEVAYEILYNASGDDLERLDLLDILLYHGLKNLKIKCKECSHEYEIKLTDSQEVEILKPFRGKETIIRNEISFGE